jgi:hypothetical protein
MHRKFTIIGSDDCMCKVCCDLRYSRKLFNKAMKRSLHKPDKDKLGYGIAPTEPIYKLFRED